jgi:hypothetical protein
MGGGEVVLLFCFAVPFSSLILIVFAARGA